MNKVVQHKRIITRAISLALTCALSISIYSLVNSSIEHPLEEFIKLHIPAISFFVAMVTMIAQNFEKRRDQLVDNTIKLLEKWDDNAIKAARGQLNKYRGQQNVTLTAFSPESDAMIVLNNYWLKVYYGSKTARLDNSIMRFGLANEYNWYHNAFYSQTKEWYATPDEYHPFEELATYFKVR